MVLVSDVGELNFLAVRLDALNTAALAELNVTLQNPKGGVESIGNSSTTTIIRTTLIYALSKPAGMGQGADAKERYSDAIAKTVYQI